MIFHAVAHRLELAIHDAFDEISYLGLVNDVLKVCRAVRTFFGRNT